MQYITFFSCHFRSNPKQVTIIYLCVLPSDAAAPRLRQNIAAEQEEARGMVFPERHSLCFLGNDGN